MFFHCIIVIFLGITSVAYGAERVLDDTQTTQVLHRNPIIERETTQDEGVFFDHVLYSRMKYDEISIESDEMAELDTHTVLNALHQAGKYDEMTEVVRSYFNPEPMSHHEKLIDALQILRGLLANSDPFILSEPGVNLLLDGAKAVSLFVENDEKWLSFKILVELIKKRKGLKESFEFLYKNMQKGIKHQEWLRGKYSKRQGFWLDHSLHVHWLLAPDMTTELFRQVMSEINFIEKIVDKRHIHNFYEIAFDTALIGYREKDAFTAEKSSFVLCLLFTHINWLPFDLVNKLFREAVKFIQNADIKSPPIGIHMFTDQIFETIRCMSAWRLTSETKAQVFYLGECKAIDFFSERTKPYKLPSFIIQMAHCGHLTIHTMIALKRCIEEAPSCIMCVLQICQAYINESHRNHNILHPHFDLQRVVEIQSLSCFLRYNSNPEINKLCECIYKLCTDLRESKFQ